MQGERVIGPTLQPIPPPIGRPIRKVVIPAAGHGTRFLPATKAQPKEMLPMDDLGPPLGAFLADLAKRRKLV